jgi:hypothetical protein
MLGCIPDLIFFNILRTFTMRMASSIPVSCQLYRMKMLSGQLKKTFHTGRSTKYNPIAAMNNEINLYPRSFEDKLTATTTE